MTTSQLRCADYLAHISEAAGLARVYVEGLGKEDFLADKKTQQAVVLVVLNLVVIGEAATKLAADYPEYVAAHPEVPWKQMRGMRNRLAHGYFEIDLDIVWETVQQALPDLERRLLALR